VNRLRISSSESCAASDRAPDSISAS